MDDITTAIETGWKMLGETSPPTISFHKDTKLLIAVGEPSKLETIDAVLKALGRWGDAEPGSSGMAPRTQRAVGPRFRPPPRTEREAEDRELMPARQRTMDRFEPSSASSSDCAPPAEESPPEPLDVAALTRRMAAGDESAYRTFYDAYFNRLSRYLLVVTAGDEDTAREALQAALVRVVRHIKVFPSDAVFWSWLTVLARSALSDQTRKRRRYLAFLDRFTQHARSSRRLRRMERRMPNWSRCWSAGLRICLAMSGPWWSGNTSRRQSVREIAGEASTSEKAVESRLVRIRRKLKAGQFVTELKHESAR